jgi:hypothetical protein
MKIEFLDRICTGIIPAAWDDIRLTVVEANSRIRSAWRANAAIWKRGFLSHGVNFFGAKRRTCRKVES